MSNGHRLGTLLLLVSAVLTSNLIAAEEAPLDTDLIQTAKLVPYLDLMDDHLWFGHAVAIDGDLMVVGAPLGDFHSPRAGAAYVFMRIDGDWHVQAKLVPSDGEVNDAFGYSVAIDGLTVVVGAPYDTGPAGNNQGSAYVFARSSNGEWSELVKLTAGDAAVGDQFGNSVAVAGDTAVVGAWTEGSAGAAYVFVGSGNSWNQQQKLLSSDAEPLDHFGSSVAVEGDTAVVGADWDDHAGGTSEGSAYVFTRSGTVWSQQQRLFADDAAPLDSFGSSVAISVDTVVVGAWQDDHGGGSDAGSAYVFVRSGNSWTQQQKLVADDAAQEDLFGFSVAVDGDTAVVGAIFDDHVATDAGSAYVFVRSGPVWSQQQELMGDVATGDLFGCAVGVTGDTIVAGARMAGNERGVANIYERAGGVWTWDQILVPQQPIRGHSGWSVAMSGDTIVVGQLYSLLYWFDDVSAAHVFVRAEPHWIHQTSLINYGGSELDGFGQAVAIDGDTIVVGARENADEGTPGWAKIFTRSGTNWNEQALIEPHDPSYGDLFGQSVSVDGGTTVIGAPWDSPSGAAYVFLRSGTTWSEQAKLTPGDPAEGDSFGWSVAVDGDTALIGVPKDDHAVGINAGSAYVFTRSGTTWTQQRKLIPYDTQSDDHFGWSVDLDGDTAVIGAKYDSHSGYSNAGSAYVFTRNGSNWTEQQKLIPSNIQASGLFGQSVALDGDTMVVGAEGAAYVFSRSGEVWTEQQQFISTQEYDDFGYSVEIEGDIVLTGAPNHDLPSANGCGATFVFEPEVAPPGLPFGDGFESGDTSAWPETVPGTIDSMMKPLGHAVSEYRTGFTIDLMTTGAINSEPTTAITGLGRGPTSVFDLELRRGSEGFEIRTAVRTDDGLEKRTHWAPVGYGQGLIEIHWRRSYAGMSDGRIEVLMDGTPVLEFNDLENSLSMLEALVITEGINLHPPL